jgi:hypothetical protein
VVTCRIVTPIPPETPTKPPPTDGDRPKTSSLEYAWTARPWNALRPWSPKPLAVRVPS